LSAGLAGDAVDCASRPKEVVATQDRKQKAKNRNSLNNLTRVSILIANGGTPIRFEHGPLKDLHILQ
jgi:hypothetical protein